MGIRTGRTSRRDFFRRSGSAVLGASMLGALADRAAYADTEKTWDNPSLVCIYLRGGADSLNAIIPHGDPLYYQYRPTIGIPREADGEEPGVIKLDRMFGLNPAMASLMPFYEKGMLAPILNVGSPHPTRSHFDAQDFMEYAAPGIRTITEGWLNRYLTTTSKGDADSKLRALAMQPLLPRSVRGDYPVLAVPSVNPDAALEAFGKLYKSCNEDVAIQRAEMRKEKEKRAEMGMAGKVEDVKGERENRHSIITSGHNTVELLRRLRKIIGTDGAALPNYPTSRFGQQMAKIARVLKAGVGTEITAVDVRGWDHHARQGSTDGVYHRMLKDLSDGLAAFATDMGPRMNKTLVLVMSEFGRTVRENGNNGSDHGHGSWMLALGGMINAKSMKRSKVLGDWKGLEKRALYQGRDMPATTDFRIVFAEVLARLFGFDPFKGKHGFFPGYKPDAGSPLNFLKKL